MNNIEKLVNDNINFVKFIAMRFKHYDRIERDDLIAAGNLGLVRAAQKFDESRGLKFTTCALHWILAEMYIVLEQAYGGRVNRRTERKAFYGRHRAIAVLGEDATDEQVAEFLGIDAESVEIQRIRRNVVSIDNLQYGDTRNKTLGDSLRDNAAPTAEDTLIEAGEEKRKKKLAKKAIKKLTKYQQRIINNRLSKSPVSQIDIAAEFGKSRQSVSAMEKKVIKRLTEQLKDAA